MAETMQVRRNKTGDLISINFPTTETICQYPSEYFSNNRRKPKINVTLVYPDLASARSVLLEQMASNRLTLEVVNTYLYHAIQKIESEDLKGWNSYGTEICRPNEKITPISLVEVNIINARKDGPLNPRGDRADDHWLLLHVTGVYRVLRATIPAYKALILRKINDQLRGLNPTARPITDVATVFQSWLCDRTYLSFIAILDMFLYRYPTHELSTIRLSTIGSRYRDCAGLLSLGFIVNLLGMANGSELAQWIFLEKTGEELITMMRPEEESDKSDSYFPYQIDLGLVTKSHYSAVANPFFFQWVHIIGALSGSIRSINAKQFSDTQLSNIITNAGAVAYAYRHVANIQKVFSDKDDPVGEEDTFDEEVVTDILNTRSPDTWYSAIKAEGNKLPEVAKDFVIRASNAIENPREGTIGRFLRNFAQSM